MNAKEKLLEKIKKEEEEFNKLLERYNNASRWQIESIHYALKETDNRLKAFKEVLELFEE